MYFAAFLNTALVSNVRIQRNIAFLAILLFFIKIIAWWYTHSVAIYTDAMESIVNVISGLTGWYSLWLAAKPRDLNHPYGHGKVEYISSAIEGTLISVAAIVILIEAVRNLKHPHPVLQINSGLILISITALINFFAGRYAIARGKKEHSIALEASGRHLQSDTITTVGIIAGLLIIRFTHLNWLDPVIAILFALLILITGYKVLRRSLAGIMDEADLNLLKEIIDYINQHRRAEWIDLHNLRMIQYGSVLHLDGHLTLPWYFNVNEAHEEIEYLDDLIKEQYGQSVELFVHVDGCLPFSCKICSMQNCPVRQHPQETTLGWTPENVLQNKKHTV